LCIACGPAAGMGGRAADGRATGPILINTAGSRPDLDAPPGGCGAVVDSAGIQIRRTYRKKSVHMSDMGDF
jgi:hypothetical protein